MVAAAGYQEIQQFDVGLTPMPCYQRLVSPRQDNEPAQLL